MQVQYFYMDQNVDKSDRFPEALRIPQQMLKKDLQNLLAKLYEKTGQRNIMTKIKQLKEDSDSFDVQ